MTIINYEDEIEKLRNKQREGKITYKESKRLDKLLSWYLTIFQKIQF